MDLQLRDKVAWVVGGADGIGAAISRALHAEGAAVAIADLNGDRARSLAAELGPRALGLTCNAGLKQDLQDAAAAAVQQFSTLHILVQAVGLTLADSLEEIREEDIDTTFTLNMRGHLWAIQAAVPAMRTAGYGRIVLLGSGSGIKGSKNLAVYSASKFWLRGLAQASAFELGPAGITVNVVCPSDVYPEGDRPAGSWRTDKLLRLSLEKEGVQNLEALKQLREKRTPMRRSCTGQDVADLVAFLASPRAGFITAQTLGLNGGGLPS